MTTLFHSSFSWSREVERRPSAFRATAAPFKTPWGQGSPPTVTRGQRGELSDSPWKEDRGIFWRGIFFCSKHGSVVRVCALMEAGGRDTSIILCMGECTLQFIVSLLYINLHPRKKKYKCCTTCYIPLFMGQGINGLLVQWLIQDTAREDWSPSVGLLWHGLRWRRLDSKYQAIFFTKQVNSI